ncbi:uncharacterized protein METZ01_LOCUS230269, partial [marine metagenome]
MKYKSIIGIAILYSLAWSGFTYAQNYDLTNPEDQKRLGISFMNN